MCIAILKTKKGKITDEALINSFDNNPDGAGIAYTYEGKLIVEKGIFNCQEFVRAVRNAEAICDSNMLIHCRIGTSGIKDERNTHPFYVNDDLVLIHNGILDVNVPKGSEINDTQIYINTFLKPFSTLDLIEHTGLHNLIADSIGSGNKFVMMDNTGTYAIINESAGHWNEGVWYSNHSYETTRMVYTNYCSGFDYKDYYDYDDKGYALYSDLTEEEADEFDSQYYYIEDAIANSSLERILEVLENPYYDKVNDCLVKGGGGLLFAHRYVKISKDSDLFEYMTSRLDEITQPIY